MPATSLNVTPMSSWAYSLPRLRPKAIAEPVPPSRRTTKMNSPTVKSSSTAVEAYDLQRLGDSSLPCMNPFSNSRLVNTPLWSLPFSSVVKETVSAGFLTGSSCCRSTRPWISS